MLSLLVVLFCGFISINGALEICKESKSEDVDCLTPCDVYGSCGKYGRVEVTRVEGEDLSSLKLHKSACKEERGRETLVSLCESIVKDKMGTNNPINCLTFAQWLDKLWAAATDAEKEAETLTTTTDIPGFDDYWAAKCQVKRADEAELRSVDCNNYQERMQIDPFHVSKAEMAWSSKGRKFMRAHLILASGKVSYYCYPASGKDTKKEDYKARLLAGFPQKAQDKKTEAVIFARSETGAAVARGGRTRAEVIGGGLPRPHVPVRIRRAPAVGAVGALPRHPAAPLPVARGAAPMNPEERRRQRAAGRRSRSSSGEGMHAHAHEEYVDNLWEEVNEIEEDELRYERAWDKLRRAQRSFDMATKLRQLRKKKLRKYYN